MEEKRRNMIICAALGVILCVVAMLIDRYVNAWVIIFAILSVIPAYVSVKYLHRKHGLAGVIVLTAFFLFVGYFISWYYLSEGLTSSFTFNVVYYCLVLFWGSLYFLRDASFRLFNTLPPLWAGIILIVLIVLSGLFRF